MPRSAAQAFKHVASLGDSLKRDGSVEKSIKRNSFSSPGLSDFPVTLSEYQSSVSFSKESECNSQADLLSNGPFCKEDESNLSESPTMRNDNFFPQTYFLEKKHLSRMLISV